jgi:hypothetical protein
MAWAAAGLVALLAASVQGASAWTFLSNTLGDGMVLQRAPQQAVVNGISNTTHAHITITMTAPAGSGAAAVKTFTTTADGKTGVWRQRLPATPATLVGTNFTFSSSAGESAALTGVVFGDVFRESQLGPPEDGTVMTGKLHSRIVH